MAGYSGGQKNKMIGRLLLLLLFMAAAVLGILFLSERKHNAPDQEEAQGTMTFYAIEDHGTEEALEKTAEDASEEMKEQEEALEEMAYSMISREDMNLNAYERIQEVSAKSWYDDDTVEKYQAASAVDGDIYTCWTPMGWPARVGSMLWIRLTEEREIKYLVLHLGDWSNFEEFRDCIPTLLEFQLGGYTLTVPFTDEQKEFVIELETPVKASAVDVVLQELQTYHVSISEVELYGRILVDKGI